MGQRATTFLGLSLYWSGGRGWRERRGWEKLPRFCPSEPLGSLSACGKGQGLVAFLISLKSKGTQVTDVATLKRCERLQSAALEPWGARCGIGRLASGSLGDTPDFSFPHSHLLSLHFYVDLDRGMRS